MTNDELFLKAAIEEGGCDIRCGILHLAKSKGFTLIELMTSIAIIGIIMSLAIYSYFRMKSSQDIRRTVSTVDHIQRVLNYSWREQKDYALKNLNGDYSWMTKQFPMTYQEASVNNQFSAYLQNASVNDLPEVQSAICLYMILKDAPGCALMSRTTIVSAGTPFLVFADSWNNPIAFIRQPNQDWNYPVVISPGQDKKFGLSFSGNNPFAMIDSSANDNISGLIAP